MTPDWLISLDEGFGGRTSGKESGGGNRDEVAAAARLSSLTDTASIPNGFYTLTFPDGSHKTFRVHTQKIDAKFAPGKRVIGLLIGPDNTADYESTAFLTRDGVQVWKRFQGGKVEVHLGILWELMNGGEVEGCEVMVSKRCLVCNRTLTDDESIERGIGPTCWGRIQGE